MGTHAGEGCAHAHPRSQLAIDARFCIALRDINSTVRRTKSFVVRLPSQVWSNRFALPPQMWSSQGIGRGRQTGAASYLDVAFHYRLAYLGLLICYRRARRPLVFSRGVVPLGSSKTLKMFSSHSIYCPYHTLQAKQFQLRHSYCLGAFP